MLTNQKKTPVSALTKSALCFKIDLAVPADVDHQTVVRTVRLEVLDEIAVAPILGKFVAARLEDIPSEDKSRLALAEHLPADLVSQRRTDRVAKLIVESD